MPQPADAPHLAAPEWLVTNGLGGYALGTATLAATRGYDGWLVAALAPPVGRTLLVAKLEPVITLPSGQEVNLSTNLYPGAVDPQGYLLIESFRPDPAPTWVFRVQGARVTLKLAMVPGRNETRVRLSSQGLPMAVPLRLVPFVNARDHHGRTAPEGLTTQIEALTDGVAVNVLEPAVRIVIRGARLRFSPGSFWIQRMRYPLEELRGYPALDAHLVPGQLLTTLSDEDPVDVEIAAGEATAGPGDPCAIALEREAEEERSWPQAIAALARRDPGLLALLRAAPAFRVRRGTGHSIIAGYPWFADWGRDTLISLTGLVLVPGHLEEAGEILTTFAGRLKNGLIPNAFMDGGEVNYHAADAPLWFVEAVARYRAYGGQEDLWPAVEQILTAYLDGTDFGIGIGPDGLVHAGSSGLALTWMDAITAGGPVTPREGAPVEVNALMYAALENAARLSPAAQAQAWEKRAQAFRAALRAHFLPGPVDRITPDGQADTTLRPNALFLAALSSTALAPEEIGALLSRLEPLRTPRGIRTLGRDEPGYRGRYEGSAAERDAAYHQGTAWPFLLGPWCTALRRSRGERGGSPAVRGLLGDFLAGALPEGMPGQLCEVYDGDAPQRPGGCPAQAWSVGEVLRALAEDGWGVGAGG